MSACGREARRRLVCFVRESVSGERLDSRPRRVSRESHASRVEGRRDAPWPCRRRTAEIGPSRVPDERLRSPRTPLFGPFRSARSERLSRGARSLFELVMAWQRFLCSRAKVSRRWRCSSFANASTPKCDSGEQGVNLVRCVNTMSTSIVDFWASTNGIPCAGDAFRRLAARPQRERPTAARSAIPPPRRPCRRRTPRRPPRPRPRPPTASGAPTTPSTSPSSSRRSSSSAASDVYKRQTPPRGV